MQAPRSVDDWLSLYARGWFPMADPADPEEVEWVQPYQRTLLPLEAGRFRVPSTLRRRVQSGRFEVTSDRAFARVIESCARPTPKREETWINSTIRDAFLALHTGGHAHSVEAWLEGPDGRRALVGGLYGLRIGSIFCGESMFSRPELGGTDASKVCLVHLVHHLRRRGFTHLDAQLENPHLDQFGAYQIPSRTFGRALSTHAGERVPWEPWEPDRTLAELRATPGPPRPR